MKTKYWILFFSALLLLCLGAGIFLLMPGEEASQAQILSDGKVLCTVDLHVDQTFEIENGNGRNTVTVSGGKIGVTEANCPDHYCMARGMCNSGTQIVCLPNGLIIRFPGEQTIDAVIG